MAVLPRYKIAFDGAYTTIVRTALPADGYEVFELFAEAKNAAAKWCGEQSRAYKERAYQLRHMKTYEVRR